MYYLFIPKQVNLVFGLPEVLAKFKCFYQKIKLLESISRLTGIMSFVRKLNFIALR